MFFCVSFRSSIANTGGIQGSDRIREDEQGEQHGLVQTGGKQTRNSMVCASCCLKVVVLHESANFSKDWTLLGGAQL